MLAGLAVLLSTAGCDSASPDDDSNRPPVARFTSQTSAEGSLEYVFEADQSSDPDGEIAAYEWTFGDGKSGSGQTVTHTYASGGSKEVTLEVTDQQGNTAKATKTIAVEPGNQKYSSEYAYQVNVIYFTPADMSPRPDFRHRYSETLLYVQDWYRQWMTHWGYGDRTFGLQVDEEEQAVKITKIKGEEPLSHYTERGGWKIRREVRSYYEKNSTEPDSKHYLVITPRYGEKGKGLPYYAIGNWGFVTDRGQNGDNPEYGENPEFFAGGIAHELGHAINLPHNEQPVSRRKRLGEALMSSGNHVWNNPQKGSSETSLTGADAAIVRQSQVFSRSEGEFYGPVNAALTSAIGTHENEDITISGTFESDVPIREAAIAMNPKGPKGYFQHTFARPVIDSDSFHVRIPISDLSRTDNNDYVVKLWLVPEHRKHLSLRLTKFEFEDGVPNIGFNYEEISRSFSRASETNVVRNRLTSSVNKTEVQWAKQESASLYRTED